MENGISRALLEQNLCAAKQPPRVKVSIPVQTLSQRVPFNFDLERMASRSRNLFKVPVTGGQVFGTAVKPLLGTPHSIFKCACVSVLAMIPIPWQQAMEVQLGGGGRGGRGGSCHPYRRSVLNSRFLASA